MGAIIIFWGPSVCLSQLSSGSESGDADIWQDLCYSYLGGGVPWDPPFSYWIVSKRLLFSLADCLLAVCLFLSGRRNVYDRTRTKCFVCRIDVTGDSSVSDEQSEHEIEERVWAVDVHLCELQLKFWSFHYLFGTFGLPFPAE